ncbi:GP11 baseplate wedge protein [compost metagenome]
MSINRQAAGVTEHTAAFATFDQTRSGGAIGDATPAQQSSGYDQPNVQSAIDDLWDRALIIPGSVYHTLSAIAPSIEPTVLYSQTVQLTITGVPTANGNITVDSTNVAVLTTDTAAGVASKIATVMAAQPFISSASVAGAVVTYTYVDTDTHPVDNKVQNGITMSTKTTVFGGEPGYLGYGSWELLGSDTKYTRTIYSWLRIA